MYNHQQLMDFGKLCAEQVTPAITNQQLDFYTLSRNFAEDIINKQNSARPDSSNGNVVNGEDILMVIARNFYGKADLETCLTLAQDKLQEFKKISAQKRGEEIT